jgi:hypothetical protein
MPWQLSTKIVFRARGYLQTAPRSAIALRAEGGVPLLACPAVLFSTVHFSAALFGGSHTLASDKRRNCLGCPPYCRRIRTCKRMFRGGRPPIPPKKISRWPEIYMDKRTQICYCGCTAEKLGHVLWQPKTIRTSLTTKRQGARSRCAVIDRNLSAGQQLLTKIPRGNFGQ